MTTISVTIETDRLHSYTDTHLATLWHVAQANPAPIGDREAGDVVEQIGREIIRRFLKQTEPDLWTHQGRHHPWDALRRLGRYDNERDEWVAKAANPAAMVDRFLGWPLPKDFGPDAGISFTPPTHPHGWPSGTNLLNADQARAMFEHALGSDVQPGGGAPT